MNEIISTNRQLFDNDNYAELRRNERIDSKILIERKENILYAQNAKKNAL